MEKRTRIQFVCGWDVWPAVERWASDNKFKPKESGENERLYQKGTGMLMAPSMLKVRQENQQISMEAWLRIDFLTRLMSLFILPSEIEIKSGGAKAVIPRNKFRGELNGLLQALGQPLVS